MSFGFSINQLRQITKDTEQGRSLWAVLTINCYRETHNPLSRAILSKAQQNLTKLANGSALAKRVINKASSGARLHELTSREQNYVRSVTPSPPANFQRRLIPDGSVNQRLLLRSRAVSKCVDRRSAIKTACKLN